MLLPDSDLDWAVFTARCARGPRGLREPAGPRLGVDAVPGADLVLVPALAVDRAGHPAGARRRLVRPGAGPAPARRTAGRALLHDGELLDEVPAEPHDRPVHAAITTGGRTVTLSDDRRVDEMTSDDAPLALGVGECQLADKIRRSRAHLPVRLHRVR